MSAPERPGVAGEAPHVLLAVSTGSGKGSVAWAEVRRLMADGLAEGQQVVVLDGTTLDDAIEGADEGGAA